MKPRYYQNDAVYAIWDYFKKGNKGNPIVAMPTGTGKSLVIASFIKSIYHYFPNQKVMMLTHVKELIEQNFGKLITIWPTAPAGIYSSGLNRKDLGMPITYAGIASIKNMVDSVGHIDMIIVDECHLISPNQNTMYGKFIIALKEVNPFLKIVGLTATPWRNGQGLLTNQPSLWTDICYDLTTIEAFNRLIEEGFLAPLIPKPTTTVVDISQVSMRGGEYVDREAQYAIDRAEITYAALQETLQVGSERDHWLIFAQGLEHAQHIQDGLESMGISCGLVNGTMKTSERDQELALFKSSHYRAMVNVGVLTTGFDFPEIDLIVILRMTGSSGLWVQMLGRGTRPAEFKENCMVLDFAGNTLRLGCINDPLIPEQKGKKKNGMPAPVRLCPIETGGCNTFIHASLRVCPHCGHTFPPEIKFKATSGTSELIAKAPKPPEINDFSVDRVVYKRHPKAGRPDTLKATYYCGLRVFHAWVCLWHEGFARKKALDWWKAAHPEGKESIAPADIITALNEVEYLKVPNSIRVQTDLKYPDILSFDYL